MVYMRLAVREENYAKQVFGELYERYAEKTPRFCAAFPRHCISHSAIVKYGEP